MTTRSIDAMQEKSSTISSCLESIPLSSIRNVLPDKAIVGACREAGYEYRDRLLTPIVIVLHMLQAAPENKVEDPLRSSFVFAVQAILNFAPVLGMGPFWKLRSIYDAILREMAAHQVEWRPGRNEPRMVRRYWKHYPMLTTTRAEWRNAYAA